MKHYILQTLLLVSGLLCLFACDDNDGGKDLSEVNAAAAAVPGQLSFKFGDTKAVAVNLSVAVSDPASESVRFDVQVADNSEVAAGKVSFSQPQIVIQDGKRSQEMTMTIEADAVDSGTKDLIVDFISSNAKVADQQVTIPVTMKLNTIKHYTGIDIKLDFSGPQDGGGVMAGDSQVVYYYCASNPIGSAPAALRIHMDNAGEDVIGVADGDVINLTPLEEGDLIGSSSKWISNPYTSWQFMPVVYSDTFKDWAGKGVAYAGMKCFGLNFWFKIEISDNLEFTLTEFAYDEEGGDIKAGQTDSTK